MSTFRALRLVTAALIAAAVSLWLPVASSAAPLNTASQLKHALDDAAPSRLIQVAGCHANPQYHMVYAWGHKALHRHGPACKPIAVLAHCHKAFQKHHHPGKGSKWHHHVGPGCHWSKGQIGGGPGVGCIKIGAVWICAAP